MSARTIYAYPPCKARVFSNQCHIQYSTEYDAKLFQEYHETFPVSLALPALSHEAATPLRLGADSCDGTIIPHHFGLLKPGSLSKVVQTYKSAFTRRSNPALLVAAPSQACPSGNGATQHPSSIGIWSVVSAEPAHPLLVLGFVFALAGTVIAACAAHRAATRGREVRAGPLTCGRRWCPLDAMAVIAR
jgi:hypothetical protein